MSMEVKFPVSFAAQSELSSLTSKFGNNLTLTYRDVREFAEAFLTLAGRIETGRDAAVVEYLRVAVELEKIFVHYFNNSTINSFEEMVEMLDTYIELASSTALLVDAPISRSSSAMVPQIIHLGGTQTAVTDYGGNAVTIKNHVYKKEETLVALQNYKTVPFISGWSFCRMLSSHMGLPQERVRFGEYKLNGKGSMQIQTGTRVYLYEDFCPEMVEKLRNRDGTPVKNLSWETHPSPSNRFAVVGCDDPTSEHSIRHTAVTCFAQGTNSLSRIKSIRARRGTTIEIGNHVQQHEPVLAVNLDDGCIYKISPEAIDSRATDREGDHTLLSEVIMTAPARKYLTNLAISVIKSDSPYKVFRRMLLSGPPGMGKSLIAKTFCKAAGLTALHQSVSELGIIASEVGPALRKLSALTTYINAVIVIDDADCFIGERKWFEQSAIVTEILRFLDSHGLPVIMSTNVAVKKIDPAVLSRVDCHIKISGLMIVPPVQRLGDLIRYDRRTPKWLVKAIEAEPKTWVAGIKLPAKSSYRTVDNVATQLLTDHRFQSAKSLTEIKAYISEKIDFI